VGEEDNGARLCEGKRQHLPPEDGKGQKKKKKRGSWGWREVKIKNQGRHAPQERKKGYVERAKNQNEDGKRIGRK